MVRVDARKCSQGWDDLSCAAVVTPLLAVIGASGQG
jgi:hypothetical protein